MLFRCPGTLTERDEEGGWNQSSSGKGISEIGEPAQSVFLPLLWEKITLFVIFSLHFEYLLVKVNRG
jgi:hypothetical protein